MTLTWAVLWSNVHRQNYAIRQVIESSVLKFQTLWIGSFHGICYSLDSLSVMLQIYVQNTARLRVILFLHWFNTPLSHTAVLTKWTINIQILTPFTLVNKPTWCTMFFLSIFLFVNLYMFRAAVDPSSGDTTVFMRNLILVFFVWMTVWYAGFYPAYQAVWNYTDYTEMHGQQNKKKKKKTLLRCLNT